MFSTLLISPFILTMVSAQMTTTAPAAVQVTTTALAAAVQTTATTPPAPGSPTANSPAAGSAAADNSAAVSSINTTDACGPKIPDPTVPDSCDTPVFQASGPSAYGVQCLNDTQTSTPVNITSCADLIQELCSNQWQRPGQWLWLTANGCSVGSFLPPTTFVGAAPWPTAAQVRNSRSASFLFAAVF